MSDMEITPASDERVHAIASYCGARLAAWSKAAHRDMPLFSRGPHDDDILSLIARIEAERKRADDLLFFAGMVAQYQDGKAIDGVACNLGLRLAAMAAIAKAKGQA